MSGLDLAIVGAGPAGLAAAIEARRRGLSVVVIEREREAGGIPRHCAHPPFGVREFGRLMTGPAYAGRLAAAAHEVGAEIRTATTVVALEPGPRLTLSSDAGVEELAPRRVLLATGLRETTRAARLIGGTKPAGVINTGTLQGLVHLEGRRPFERPLIVGTELVAFSAILTCRHAGIRPLAMVEAAETVTARWPSALLPRLLGIPVWRDCRLLAVEGARQVEAVLLEGADGRTRRVATDGVILTGAFRPEATLVRTSHLVLDAATGGPEIDQFGRTCDPTVFAAGNVLRPVETAGWCFREGRRMAGFVAASLADALPAPEPSLRLVATAGYAWVLPQRIAPGERTGELQLRVARSIAGRPLVATDPPVRGAPFASRPERRLSMPLAALPVGATGTATIAVEPDGLPE